MTKSSNQSRNTFSPQVQEQIKDTLLRVGELNAELETILEPYKPPSLMKEPAQIIENLFQRFHSVARQLQERQRERPPFTIGDEYDVQDLLHSLLRIYFEDIRPEEYCPSYAGTSARIDFFLKEEHTTIEAKMANEDHRRRKISEELILDKEYYSKKEGVQSLYCLVYDPFEIITNPRGFERDLSEKSQNFEVKVFVVPRKA
jgi:hypothetical protein